MENEIAADLERRHDLALGAIPALDAQIDLRLIERWLDAAAGDAPQGEALQIAASIRITELQSLAGLLAERLESTPDLSATQLEGLKELHATTFKLKEPKSVAEMDSVLRKLATDLILAAGPSPADTKDLPPMRPANLRESDETNSTSIGAGDLAARVKGVDVSPALRRELTALVASTSASDLKEKDRALLEQSLRQAVALSEGLGQMSALDPMSRAPLEEQITQALALLNDPRTRAAGKSRLDALSEYRKTFDSLSDLKLPPDLRQKLAPALLWARQNAGTGAAFLELTKTYLTLCASADAFHETSSTGSAHKAIEAIQKQFAAHRASFLSEAGDLEKKGAAAAKLKALETHIAQMRQSFDAMCAIDRLTKSIQALDAFKPRPRGMLERRSVAALSDLSSPVSTERRDQALRFVLDVDRLARVAESFEGATSGISPLILKQYMGEHPDIIESRRVALIAELASQIGAGKQLERTQIARLESLAAVLRSLADAGKIEAAIPQQDVLTRWVDWTINSDRLNALLASYRQATQDALEGFAGDNSTALNHWPEVHQRFEPLFREVLHASDYAGACAKLPSGYFAQCAKLMTPLDNQPGAAQRRVSCVAWMWSECSNGSDAAGADAVLDSLK